MSTFQQNIAQLRTFTIIETLKDQGKDLTTTRRILEDREDFGINKLKTLKPNGFNQTLNRNKNNQSISSALQYTL